MLQQPRFGKQATRHVSTSSVQKHTSKRRCGGDLACHAILSQRCRGFGRALLDSSLAEEYHALSSEELQEFTRIGELVASTHSTGGASFGLVQREALRKVGREETTRRVKSALRDGVMRGDREPSGMTASTPEAFAESLSKIVADQRILNSIRREAIQVAEIRIFEWEMKDGVRARDRAVSLHPVVVSMPEVCMLLIGQLQFKVSCLVRLCFSKRSTSDLCSMMPCRGGMTCARWCSTATSQSLQSRSENSARHQDV